MAKVENTHLRGKYHCAAGLLLDGVGFISDSAQKWQHILENGKFSASFSLFSSFQHSWQKTNGR